MPDITSNLAVHLRLESNGTDSSGNGRNFTMTGTVPHSAGRIGNGCTPTATNYYNFTNPTWLDSKSAFTVAFWCKAASYASSPAAVSFGTAAAGGSTVIYPFDSASGGGAKVFSNGVSFPFLIGGGNPATGSWQFLCYVVESTSSAKLYLNNGAPATYTAASLATAASQTHFRIGHYHNGGQAYNGEIDEVRVYTRALDASDVAALYAYTGSETFIPQAIILQ